MSSRAQVGTIRQGGSIVEAHDQALRALRKSYGGVLSLLVLLALLPIFIRFIEGGLLFAYYSFLAVAATYSGVYWAVQALRFTAPRGREK